MPTPSNALQPADATTSVLHAEQWVPLPVEKVFPFFADEKNLEILTPPFLHFHVLGKSTPAILMDSFIGLLVTRI